MCRRSLFALARLQLARALVLIGNIAKAKTAYQDFFALWKDADQDLPILIEAKKGYAALPRHGIPRDAFSERCSRSRIRPGSQIDDDVASRL